MVASEVLEYYVSRAKLLDVVEPNIMRLRTILDKLEDNPSNYDEYLKEIFNASMVLVTVWEKQNG